MSAKEMFEEIGFTQKQKMFMIIYEHASGTKLGFNTTNRGYTLGIPKRKLAYNSNQEFCVNIGFKVHNAISQQLKELGWLDA